MTTDVQITHDTQTILGRDARDRRGDALAPTAAGAYAALENFYHAFNHQSLEVFDAVWAPSDLIQLNNPLGGIQRGFTPIRNVYQKIFNGPAAVWVEFHNFVAYITTDSAVFAGYERGEFSRDGQTIPLHIRTTRIFHYLGSELGWRQVHHHGSIDDPALLGRYQAAVTDTPADTSIFTCATLSIKPDAIPDFLSLTQPLLTASQQEEGVERFTLHQNTENNSQFLFYERFKSPAALEAHRAAPHTQTWFTQVKPLLAAAPNIINLQITPNQS